MLELDAGSIIIDGVSIGTIPREEVRRRLNTLPQEPFFLHGSIRDNVDPLHVTNDERIIEALKSVQLWTLIEARGGLDGDISEELLSHGEQQLFCLARAIVRPGNIIIMDEATSKYVHHTLPFIILRYPSMPSFYLLCDVEGGLLLLLLLTLY
jgi:ATP-binding cassette subfamily C (CFTR/MRP) protein 1